MYAYRLKATNRTSAALGNCECCHKPAGEVYILTQMRRYNIGQKEGVTLHGCFQLFGHKECLTNKTYVKTS